MFWQFAEVELVFSDAVE
jgi:hypothetical protein